MPRYKAFLGIMLVVLFGLGTASHATPQFARKFDVSCNACHTIPPMLSAEGLAFQAGAYVPRARETAATEGAEPRYKTIPMAVWVTVRHEDQGEDGASELYLPKVELISGGRINKRWAYFVEWRIVSLGLRPDGELQDRSGRFEDLFFDWGFVDTHMVRFGQYRALNQVDVSLRLSTSEPLLFRNGLRVDSDPDPRVDALSRFSPSGRS